MTQGVLTMEQLQEVVAAYLEFDEYVMDVETMGEFRGDPNRNDVFWISLAGPGRADAIPCGHPLGERVPYDPDDMLHRIAPNKHHQERRINPDSGREKWFDIPERFTDPPQQLWIWDVAEALRPLFFSEQRKIGQNFKFDVLSMAKYYNGEIMPGPYGDTLVAARLINENHFVYDLGNLVKREFKYSYEKIGKAGPDKFPYSEAELYSYLDAKYEWLLWQKYKKQMDKENVRHIFDLEMDLFPVIIDMEQTGVPVDEPALDVLGREFALELARLQLSLNERAGYDINLNANQQVANFVYDILGKPCTTYTKTAIKLMQQGVVLTEEQLKKYRSTSKETLELFQQSRHVRDLLEFSGLDKLQGTFIKGIKGKIVDDRLHPDFNQVGAVSGRLTCRQPNIQQIPSRSERGKRVREVFIASPGNVLIVSDLSQIELRMLAHLTQDRQLLRAYREGLDLHAITAQRVFGDDFTPLQRTLAKNVNFSVIFGVGPKTLARKYQVPSVQMAEDLLAGFYAAYKRVKPWKQEVLDEARSRYKKGRQPPYVETILGRKRRLPDLYSMTNNFRWGAERQAISVRVSGSAADLFKVAMIDCQNLLNEVSWEGHILMTVHDELVVEVPEAHADEALTLVESSMTDILHPFTGEPMLSVPVTADAKIVTRWSEAK